MMLACLVSASSLVGCGGVEEANPPESEVLKTTADTAAMMDAAKVPDDKAAPAKP